MKISIAIDPIADTLLADSALSAVLSHPADSTVASVPRPLNHDHIHALRRLILSAAASLCTEPPMPALITALDLPALPAAGALHDAPHDPTIHITFSDQAFPDVAPQALIHYVVSALTSRSMAMLSLAASDYSRATSFDTLVAHYLATIRDLTAGPSRPFTASPSWL